ncbi:Ies5p NDAI_0A01720 [Naumovozyma dairenensis CBS 421]|uniref:Uncharacterized protein n=1 Tax=Naumovozyma dairenensis (strain ATCC 10597 / BCRC 20456 / CBS 421 / NBRC 0211 / NRRL Y-12639) TaxID=1071378 RepID=G0W3E2_NAUDC|nr:hypothetical protein NDAI_0A01720 [Naumovozyma dairenensis CBS 421]CCD22330.1 hypothetical protein NDAI_0A01720 [Naumovozyma dairenensis CBS 421]
MSQDPILEKELHKLVVKNDEFVKQDAALKKEYTTLLRKINSVVAVLKELDPEYFEQQRNHDTAEPRLISVGALQKVPKLEWYNRQITRVIQNTNGNENFELPNELIDSYKLYKDSPLLYKDILE